MPSIEASLLYGHGSNWPESQVVTRTDPVPLAGCHSSRATYAKPVLRLAILLGTAAAAAGLSAVAGAQPASAPTLSVSAKTVVFGAKLTLRGSVPGAAMGEQVQIMGQVCGFTGAVPIGFARTTAGGKFTYSMAPMLSATLFAQVGDATSAKAEIRVSPGIQLRRISAQMFAIDVSSGNGAWFTKPVTLQRLDPATKKWRLVGTAPLKANSGPDALVAVSSAKLHATVKRGTQLRAIVPQSTVGACYLPAFSPTLTA